MINFLKAACHAFGAWWKTLSAAQRTALLLSAAVTAGLLLFVLYLLVFPWRVLGIVLLIIVVVILSVAFATFAERRILGFLHFRHGPNRCGPFGVVQPFADVFKLLTKEVIIPTKADRNLFLVAPIIMLFSAFTAWAVVPFGDGWVSSNIDGGMLYLLAMTSLGIYGVIIGGWASNSKYSQIGALRAAAHMIGYELAMGFALITVMMTSGSLNLSDIVRGQTGSIFHWYWVPLLPMCVIYFVCGVAETNRAPFDITEGESEIVAGFHIEYSGTAFALFFLAEYGNMLLISTMTSIFFLGGWLSPFQGIPWLGAATAGIPGAVWLFIKIWLIMFIFYWFRATLPRFRYDQVMRLGWKVFLPITMVWIVVVALFQMTGFGPWY